MNSTRDRIKEAATSLFLKRGYAKTSIAAIETAAGLAPRAGGFYRHFDSKEALLVAIGEEDIIEKESDFTLDEVFPLGDTRAELLLIARTYLRVNDRQRDLYDLISEVRRIPAIATMEEQTNRRMLAWLCDWLSGKAIGLNLDRAELTALSLTVFGGLLFYLTKRLQGMQLRDLDDEAYLLEWVDYWAPRLDAPTQI